MNAETAIQRVIWSRQDVGMTASVRQRNDLLVHTFVTDFPSLILLRRGRKKVKVRGTKIVILPGDAVAIAGGAVCDVQNETERGKFESSWIVCSNSILSRVEKESPDRKKLKDVAALKQLGSDFVESFDRAVQAIVMPERVPDVVAQHRVQELLAWLAYSDLVFSAETPFDLHRRVRLMIGSAPDKSWVSKDLAQSLGMSEATFRRRLANQGKSFNDILIDVRMTTALTLLQVTDRAISDIAYQVGYESASRFSVRFKKRFGFSPTAVRGVPSQL